MFATWRLAMTWVHTWLGLVLGYLLMAIFFFGSLSVFDREIDRWAIPETRIAAQPMPSWDDVIAPALARIAPKPEVMAKLDAKHPGAPRRTLRLASAGAFRTQRDPAVSLYTSFDVLYADGTKELASGPETMIDARSGAALPPSAFALGSRFFFPLHIHLHLERVADIGYWLVGLAAMGMLLALVSGVVIHRRLFAELFTFRAQKNRQRATLDLHDVTGVLALPFHFVFAFTGLVVFAAIYLPVSSTVLSPLHAKHEREESAELGFVEVRAEKEAPFASVDAMMREAERLWSTPDRPATARDFGYVYARFPGDANASVSMYRAGRDRVTMSNEGLNFSGTTGALLSRDPTPGRIAEVESFLTAVHLAPFEQWAVRWLYLAGGLAGCVCIATGLLFFVRKRARKHPKGARWAEAFSIGAVLGPVIATGAILLANRLVSGEMQPVVFWLAWLLSFVHAALRHERAWSEQCWVLAVLGIGAVFANAATTGDHLGRTLFTQRFWPVAGVDLALLVAAALAVFSARTIRERDVG